MTGMAAGRMAERGLLDDGRFTPVREPGLTSYDPNWSDRLRWALLGDNPNATPGRRKLANNLTGLLDFIGVTAPGNVVSSAKKGDYGDAALEAMAVIPGPGKVGKAAGKAKKAVKAATNTAQIPALRNIPTKEAIKIARKEPHLIPSADRAEGAFLGGPRNIKNKRQLNRLRKELDEFIARDPQGADWYDRYRAGIDEATGADPRDRDWMSAMEGQFSAGVHPEGEFGFAIKENNGWLTGYPVKAARPAQHDAVRRSIEANDWRPAKKTAKTKAGEDKGMLLGKKTGEYAAKINPNNSDKFDTATGVNDFRHARNFGYTDASGKPQKEGLGAAQHTFLDYETALAVDRANKAKLGGRTDWTGEKLQAAPWVIQKADDLMKQRPSLSREEAMSEATKTITDFFDKHTAYATYEAFPGANTGHLPGSIGASQAEREAFSSDPASTWATAPGGRDAIYAGLRRGETGIAGRVRPTVEMQGLYTPPGGLLETNPGEAARPLVGAVKRRNAKGKTTRTNDLPEGDKAMLEAGESVRAFIDAQDAGAAHKPWFNPEPKDVDSFFFPLDRKASKGELVALQGKAGLLGYPDVVDTGRGITLTNFGEGGGPRLSQKQAKGLLADARTVLPTSDARPANIGYGNSVYADFVDAWKAGEGSGAATRQMLETVNKTPELRAAFDNNPHIAERALAKAERDEKYAAKWGATRQDIQNARRILSEGPGGFTRLEQALKDGKIALPVIGLFFAGAAMRPATAPGEREGS